MARQTKTPLAERDANVATKKPSRGKNATKDTPKDNESNELIDAANKITKTHGRKRSHEDDPVTATQDISASSPALASGEVIPSSDPYKVTHISDSALESGSESENDVLIRIMYDCNQVRTRLRALVNSKEMKIGELQDALNVSGNSYRNFMGQSGAMGGQHSDTFANAQKFLADREKKGLKTPRTNTSKKAKTEKDAEAGKYDVSEILLEGEDSGTVPIYDTCDDVRTKINAYLRLSWTTQAGLGRAISETFPVAGEPDKKVTGAQLTRFLQKKGADAGATSPAFYAAYVYFEKLRIKQKKNKSKKRLEMEKEHGPGGMPTDTDSNTRYTTLPNERPWVDKYGKVQFG